MEAQIPIWWISILLPVAAAIIGSLARLSTKTLAYLIGLTLLIPGLATMYYWTMVGDPYLADPVSIDLAGYGVGTFMLVLDGLSAPIVLGISIVTALVSIYSIKYMETRISEMVHEGEKAPSLYAYYVLYAAFAVSMLGMALSNNLIEFYIFLEISLLSSFPLILYYGYGDRRKIALLYFVWTHVAGALLLAAILVYGIRAGTFDVFTLDAGSIAYGLPASAVLGEAARVVAGLFIIGLFIKMAVLGVHMWLPYAHAEAPTPVSALLSPNLIGIAGYALARFGIPLFPDAMASLKGYLMALGLATIIYGALVALRQTDFKRFLAYSSVSQMGYLLLGIGTLTAYGIGGAMLHYLSHAIGKAVLFMVAGVFITELHGLRDIRKMGGLARAYPLTAAAALLGFMHLVGMPPTIGMWSEILITFGVVQAFPMETGGQVYLLAAALIVAFGLSAAYAFITMKKIFYGQFSETVKKLGVKPGFEVKDAFKMVVVLMAILGVFYFVVVGPIMPPLEQASRQLVSLVAG